MGTYSYLTAAELRRLNASVHAIPGTQLRLKAAAVLLLAGMTAMDLCAAQRSWCLKGCADYPSQIGRPGSESAEVVILTDEAARVVGMYMATHSSPFVLPGMAPRTLKALLASCQAAAAVRHPVDLATLRKSVRRALRPDLTVGG
ncbi:hypothetical protein RI138_19250 [Streptomyces sp. C11-1]|uniref:Uncharacterized protein n=1 Tax=Streptomyces durocortorensis TaxID=2811104 RepID=A0ABY9VY24_9ACTN|nr:hypothetical protein [Streptomyces durocortorensis]WNF28789.1 hypothetical protein RI138_19250 [Streptomyces durocortorensis]